MSILGFQEPHVRELVTILERNKTALDASVMGLGKTYCATEVARRLRARPFILCPMSVVQSWKKIMESFGLRPLAIMNYEMIRGGKHFDEALRRVPSPYYRIQTADGKKTIRVELPPGSIVIIDEAHRCKNLNTLNNNFMKAVFQCPNTRMLLLSATISDRLECFRSFLYVFGVIPDTKSFKAWMTAQKTVLARRDPCYIFKTDATRKEDLERMALHKALFEEKRASRLRISDAGDAFPENRVIPGLYHIDRYEEVDRLYGELNAAVGDMKRKEVDAAESLSRIIRARQRIELLKIPIMIDLYRDAAENGYSVVFFVSFRETMEQLSEILGIRDFICGGQEMKERDLIMERFQNNEIRAVICIIQAGGAGISLHDIHGDNPRMSIVSPGWSAQDLVQCLGRIHRTNGKTPCLQKIIFCGRTFEEKICKAMERKMNNLSGINDNDLTGMGFATQKIDWSAGEAGAVDESFFYQARRIHTA